MKQESLKNFPTVTSVVLHCNNQLDSLHENFKAPRPVAISKIH